MYNKYKIKLEEGEKMVVAGEIARTVVCVWERKREGGCSMCVWRKFQQRFTDCLLVHGKKNKQTKQKEVEDLMKWWGRKPVFEEVGGEGSRAQV